MCINETYNLTNLIPAKGVHVELLPDRGGRGAAVLPGGHGGHGAAVLLGRPFRPGIERSRTSNFAIPGSHIGPLSGSGGLCLEVGMLVD